MAWIRVGRFKDFKGSDSLLIEADSNGLELFIAFLRDAQRSPAGLDIASCQAATVHGNFSLIVENVENDRGLSVESPQELRWRRSLGAWAGVIDELQEMLRAGKPCHQFLDGPHDDLQVIAAIGEYGDDWWRSLSANL